MDERGDFIVRNMSTGGVDSSIGTVRCQFPLALAARGR
jgi:hypothetical protein